MSSVVIDEILSKNREITNIITFEDVKFYQEMYITLDFLYDLLFSMCCYSQDIIQILFNNDFTIKMITNLNNSITLLKNLNFNIPYSVSSLDAINTQVLIQHIIIFYIWGNQYNNHFIEKCIYEIDVNIFEHLHLIINNSFTDTLLNIIKTCKSNTCNKNITLPDEFYDALTYVEIFDPVVLPNVNNAFFDRSTIMQSLYNKSENPFTRDKLTIEEFIEYNNSESVKLLIHDFLERKNKCVQQHE